MEININNDQTLFTVGLISLFHLKRNRFIVSNNIIVD